MKYIDRAFASAILMFLAGALLGATITILSTNMREIAVALLQARMVSPLQMVSHLGDIAVFLVVFANNSVPVILSFVYPFALAKIVWTPPLGKHRRALLLSSYTFIAAFLIGFFSVGTPLAVAWVLGGTRLSFSLIFGARIHAPLEFALVLVCVAEPLRLSSSARGGETIRQLIDDRWLLAFSIAGLLVSGAIEVSLGI